MIFTSFLALFAVTATAVGLAVPSTLARGRYTTALRSSSTSTEEEEEAPLTTVILRIGYDGSHFTGWSAANDDKEQAPPPEVPWLPAPDATGPVFKQSRRRRRKERQYQKGHVRSVEGTIRTRLAKLYGNVDPSRIVVEGCGRTDKGVHADYMVAQIYCLSPNFSEHNSTIPGKRLPHPAHSKDDSCFLPLPMDMARLMYVLNRMLPHDCKIRAVSPVPPSSGKLPFHPTLSSISKTYHYTFSVGPIHDPTRLRTCWHALETTKFNLEALQQVCNELLVGTHDFSAFRGAPRGSDEKRRHAKESTICTLEEIVIQKHTDEIIPDLQTFTVTITGNRFLYKMMRFLVGSLVAVGSNKLMLEDVRTALETGEWSKAFVCAPAHGLILKNVTYEEPVEWITCRNRVSSY